MLTPSQMPRTGALVSRLEEWTQPRAARSIRARLFPARLFGAAGTLGAATTESLLSGLHFLLMIVPVAVKGAVELLRLRRYQVGEFGSHTLGVLAHRTATLGFFALLGTPLALASPKANVWLYDALRLQRRTRLHTDIWSTLVQGSRRLYDAAQQRPELAVLGAVAVIGVLTILATRATATPIVAIPRPAPLPIPSVTEPSAAPTENISVTLPSKPIMVVKPLVFETCAVSERGVLGQTAVSNLTVEVTPVSDPRPSFTFEDAYQAVSASVSENVAWAVDICWTALANRGWSAVSGASSLAVRAMKFKASELVPTLPTAEEAAWDLVVNRERWLGRFTCLYLLSNPYRFHNVSLHDSLAQFKDWIPLPKAERDKRRIAEAVALVKGTRRLQGKFESDVPLDVIQQRTAQIEQVRHSASGKDKSFLDRELPGFRQLAAYLAIIADLKALALRISNGERVEADEIERTLAKAQGVKDACLAKPESKRPSNLPVHIPIRPTPAERAELNGVMEALRSVIDYRKRSAPVLALAQEIQRGTPVDQAEVWLVFKSHSNRLVAPNDQEKAACRDATETLRTYLGLSSLQPPPGGWPDSGNRESKRGPRAPADPVFKNGQTAQVNSGFGLI